MPRTIAELPGGLTNANHKVVTQAGAYVVRRWSDDTGLLAIDRDNEHWNTVRAAETGVAAPAVAYLPEHNAMVLEFIEGRTMSPEELRTGGHIARVADACRRLHSARRFRDDFDMFETQPRYLGIVQARGFRLPDRYLEFAPHVAAIREAFSRARGAHGAVQQRSPGRELHARRRQVPADRLRVLGQQRRVLRAGQRVERSNLSLAQLEELVAAYYGRALRHKVARARLSGLISKYGWTLWASIQDGVSDIDFDFWSWGMEKYDRAVTKFDATDFERLLWRRSVRTERLDRARAAPYDRRGDVHRRWAGRRGPSSPLIVS